MRLSEHFTLQELCRSDKAAAQGISNIPSVDTIAKLKILCDKILEPIREFFNIPFSPNSGYRSPEVNELVGGSKKSSHMKGEAADIEIPGVSNYNLATWIKNHLDFDQLILENYEIGNPSSGWVHVSYTNKNRNQTLTYTGGQYISGLIL